MELVWMLLSGAGVAVALAFGIALAVVITVDGVKIERRDEAIAILKTSKREWYDRARRAEAELVKRGVVLPPDPMTQPVHPRRRVEINWAARSGG